MAGTRIALGTCLVSVLVAAPAHAQFVIKQPAVERDVLSIVGHGSRKAWRMRPSSAPSPGSVATI